MIKPFWSNTHSLTDKAVAQRVIGVAPDAQNPAILNSDQNTAHIAAELAACFLHFLIIQDRTSASLIILIL
jgi:hypothetical protein